MKKSSGASDSTEKTSSNARRQKVNKIKELATSKRTLEADRAWELYSETMSMHEVARQMGCSIGKAHQLVTERCIDLREVQSAERRAACIGVLMERYNEVRTIAIEKIKEIGGDPRGTSGLLAVALRADELLGRLHGVGGDITPSTVTDAARLEEVARRLTMFGPHSRAQELKRAFHMAEIKMVKPVEPVKLKDPEKPPVPRTYEGGEFVVE